jgi:hypothetical protein
MRNTSLDEFGDDSEDDEEAVDADGQAEREPAGEAGEGSTSGSHDSGGDSGPPTSRWRPEGTECADCAETTTRLWRQEGNLVCASCRKWK